MAVHKSVSLLKLIGTIVVAGALVAAVGLPFIAGAGLVTRNVAEDFNNQKCDTSLLNATLSQKTTILAGNGQPITQLYQQNRDIALPQEIPKVIKDALVSIEDRRFYEHRGVDVKGLLRASIRTSNGDTQGASTLTQQLVKQLNLYTATTTEEQAAAVAQTAGRKLKEARCALELEQKFSKDQILTKYLNIANFGASAFGIKTAMKIYFPKTRLNQMTVAQAAMLAGLVQSPTRYNSYQHPQAAKDRRHEVLAAMLRDKKITAAQEKRADATPVPTGKQPAAGKQKGCAQAGGGGALNLGFFCDYVVDYLENTLGISENQLFTGGYQIKTTIQPEMQRVVQQSVMDHMGAAPESVGVMDVVDPATGKVLAMGISRMYGTGPRQTVQPLGVKAIAGAGSTYKVFTMLAALKARVPVRDYTLSTPNNSYTPQNCPQHHEVHNAGHYPDTMDLQDATFMSSNTFFTALIDQRFQCDLTQPVNMALALGLNSYKRYAATTINEHQVSFTLGPNPTSPLEMASAYSTMVNNGTHCPATPIESIKDASNHLVTGLRKVAGCVSVFSPGIAHTAIQVLQKDTSAENGATASVAQLDGYATAGKTGTNGGGPKGDDGNAAMWFIGMTPNLAASAAVFNPTSTSKPVRDIPGYEGQNLFGGKAAAPIWRDAMVQLQSKFTTQPWPPEDPDVAMGDAVPLPSVVGMDKETAKRTLEDNGFNADFGDPVDSPQPKDKVADQSPQGRAEKGSTITLHLSTGTPPGGQPAPNPLCQKFPQLPQCKNPPGGRGGGGGGGH